jgi:hypothetical protein
MEPYPYHYSCHNKSED